MGFPPQYYATVAAACFVLGGCMELFMIKTGFYEKCGQDHAVTSIEAVKLQESREERQAFLDALKARYEGRDNGGGSPPSLGK